MNQNETEAIAKDDYPNKHEEYSILTKQKSTARDIPIPSPEKDEEMFWIPEPDI